jgi:ferric-dicitrate binding protein FerR (iron transport regulator)
MEQQEINSLLEKYQEGTASPAEIDALHNWYREMGYVDGVYPDEELLVKNRIHNKLIDTINPVRKVRLWPRIAVASRRKVGTSLLATAAALAVITLGVWLYSNKYQDASIRTGSTASVKDIAPGKNGATITLANGKVIQLSDAKSGVVVGGDLKYNDGSDVRYSSGTSSSGSLKGSQNSSGPVGVHSLTPNSMMLTASTARGQTYQFTLPDGTKVWLNADSKLEFPSNFINSETRNVKLSGEGYFEVAKNKKIPFIVQTDKQEVEVLGTHFNINSYSNESSVRTTLLEGSVSVRHAITQGGKGGGAVILKPNQQASLDEKFQIQVQEVVDAERAIAWRNANGKAGTLYFQNEDLESLMRKVERWYDVQVVYRFKHKRTDMAFTGAVSRDATLSQMIKLLQHTGSFTYKIEGRRLIIMD